MQILIERYLAKKYLKRTTGEKMTNLPIDIQTIAAGRFDPAAAVITQLRHEEDDEPYSVWRIEAGGQSFILKEAKEYESEVYRTFLSDA